MQKKKSLETPAEPPELVPPDAEPVAPRRGGLMLLLGIFTIFVIIDLAILAWFLLPGKTDKKKQQPVQPKQEQPVNSPENPRVIPKEMTGGDVQVSPAGSRMRDRWLRAQAEAEADGVDDWAGDALAAIRETAAEADRFLAKRLDKQAVLKYREAISALQSLQASRPALLADALAAGGRALAEGDSKAAQAAFTRALALDPENTAAKQGIDRAKNIDQVTALYAKAQAAR
ncbi:MAG TPA: hypothetical protein ENK84_12675, partial [Desulfobulbus sp.]|nr:hypothetical protein [Desulfobulbus sp.]